MNFRLIALASCVALGSIAFGGKAQAQTSTVPFGGTITTVCTFGTPVPGTLVRTGSLIAVEATTGVVGFSTGTAGSVTLNCTGAASTVTVAPPAGTAPTGFAPAVFQSVVQRGTNTGAADYTSANAGGVFDTGSWTTLGSNVPLAVPVGTSTLNVGMVVGTNSTVGVLPAGTYNYNVMLTANPN